MPTEPDDIDREVAMTAARLGIQLPQTWLPGVREHLLAIRKASDLVDSFPLPDEAEPAPVFEA